MHIDSRDIEAGAVIQADLCIVGAGAAGISIAREWEGKGKKVALLEGGGFELEMGMQELYHGKITGQRYFPLQSSRMHFFGGTTAHWAGFCSTYDPIDFKERPWVKDSGWPFPFEAIEGYYERAMALVDIRPYPFDASFWENKERVFERIPFDKDKIWTKMWQFSPPTRFGQKYRDEIIHARDIFLYTHTNLVEIETGESGREVSKVIVANLAGKRFEVKAKHYVLACGAIQNARMLLASNHQRPNGLGNDFDLVGRYFMEHLELSTAEMVLSAEQPL
ncbi:MAG: FAD-dependent oxidoreductase, partial [Cyclobacteriaceae bacterium]|nr:FAD-dependent oxidoreductase [Cyclobacteriaceae bacterium]